MRVTYPVSTSLAPAQNVAFIPGKIGHGSPFGAQRSVNSTDQVRANSSKFLEIEDLVQAPYWVPSMVKPGGADGVDPGRASAISLPEPQ